MFTLSLPREDSQHVPRFNGAIYITTMNPIYLIFFCTSSLANKPSLCCRKTVNMSRQRKEMYHLKGLIAFYSFKFPISQMVQVVQEQSDYENINN